MYLLINELKTLTKFKIILYKKIKSRKEKSQTQVISIYLVMYFVNSLDFNFSLLELK